MDLKIKNKTALVLGSSDGIGKAIAKSLYMEGVNICLASRSVEKLEKAHAEIAQSSGPKIIYKVCDVSRLSDIEEVIEFCRSEIGEIDILINNQGGPVPGSFDSINEEQLQKALETNLLSFFRTTKRCIDSMKKRRWGRIINILSISAKEPLPNMLLSNMTRPAILGMSKTLAQETASFGVTINSVLPSAVLTERSRFFINEKAKTEEKSFEVALSEVAASLPSKYLASPEEFAQVVSFLCSDHSGYINGAAIPVDGAFSKSLY